MKKTLFPVIIVLLLGAVEINAQNVGINSTGAAPNASAMLDVSSTSSGFLVPRMTQGQRNSIGTPATGLLIYQTNVTPGFYYYDGAVWQPFAGGGGSGWSLTGDAGTTVGTNFLGTTDLQDFAIYVNNSEAIRVRNDGNVGIGVANPFRKLMVDGDIQLGYWDMYRVGAYGALYWNSGLGNIRVGATNPVGLEMMAGSATARMFIDETSGNVGINNMTPSAKLDVVGNFQLVDGTQAAGRVLTSDATGNASWQFRVTTEFVSVFMPAVGQYVLNLPWCQIYTNGVNGTLTINNPGATTLKYSYSLDNGAPASGNLAGGASMVISVLWNEYNIKVSRYSSTTSRSAQFDGMSMSGWVRGFVTYDQ